MYKQRNKVLSLLLGKRLEDSQLSSEKFNTLWGIPVFASDAISSVSYAGEEILLVLVPFLGMASSADHRCLSSGRRSLYSCQ